MARISAERHNNLWGKAADNGLEPQRSDLWMVSFDVAIKGIQAAYSSPEVTTPTILPQYVRKVTLPENRLRTEAIRRGSIPFQTPSWDEPLDAVKVQFLLVQDSSDSEHESVTLSFLNQWLQLTRAGRGLRSTQGPSYSQPEAQPLRELPGSPGKLVMPDFEFDFDLMLLRGAIRATPFPSKVQVVQMRQEVARIMSERYQTTDKLKLGPAASESGANTPAQLDSLLIRGGELEIATHIIVKGAWLGGYQISELSYEGSGLTSVDATFYPGSLLIGNSPQ